MFKNVSTFAVATVLILAMSPASAESPLSKIVSLVEAKTIFVSSVPADSGNLGGLAGADAFCQQLANAPGSIVPAGEYVALLSTDSVNASARVTPTSAPFIRPDGRFVASSAAALFIPKGGSSEPPPFTLINPISIDETGQDLGFAGVWTGTSGNTESGFHNCLNWTSDSATDFGNQGGAGNVDFIWIGPPVDATPCHVSVGHLYCVKR